MISDGKKRLTLSLDVDTIEQLDKLAERYHCSKSALAQILILDGVERIRRADQEPAPAIPSDE